MTIPGHDSHRRAGRGAGSGWADDRRAARHRASSAGAPADPAESTGLLGSAPAARGGRGGSGGKGLLAGMSTRRRATLISIAAALVPLVVGGGPFYSQLVQQTQDTALRQATDRWLNAAQKKISENTGADTASDPGAADAGSGSDDNGYAARGAATSKAPGGAASDTARRSRGATSKAGSATQQQSATSVAVTQSAMSGQEQQSVRAYWTRSRMQGAIAADGLAQGESTVRNRVAAAGGIPGIVTQSAALPAARVAANASGTACIERTPSVLRLAHLLASSPRYAAEARRLQAMLCPAVTGTTAGLPGGPGGPGGPGRGPGNGPGNGDQGSGGNGSGGNGSGGNGSGGSNVTPTPRSAVPDAVIDNGTPYAKGGLVEKTTGKVFFTLNGNDFVCSGSAVKSGDSSTVLTAGHCVVENGKFATKWAFVPGFSKGSAPFGTFVATNFAASPDYVSKSDPNVDFAFVNVGPNESGKKLTDVVGGQAIGFDTARGKQLFSFGYPQATPFDGQSLISCAGLGTDDPRGLIDQGLACSMTGGSSGGPWFADFDATTGTGTLVSVNSLKYTVDQTTMFGPYLSTAAKQVFTAVSEDPKK